VPQHVRANARNPSYGKALRAREDLSLIVMIAPPDGSGTHKKCAFLAGGFPVRVFIEAKK